MLLMLELELFLWKKEDHLLISARSSLMLNQNTLTYDKELYTVVQALKHWEAYFICVEFVLYSDHEA